MALDIVVDLWTAEEGRSDLVLEGWVAETDSGPRLTIHMVYARNPGSALPNPPLNGSIVGPSGM